MTNAANRILLVDDEPSLLKMMSVYLGRLGYAVVTAGGTENAWATVKAAPRAFALAVLDGTMSGIPWKIWLRVCWRPTRECA
jgi:DNA-binding response OmpR family regulator